MIAIIREVRVVAGLRRNQTAHRSHFTGRILPCRAQGYKQLYVFLAAARRGTIVCTPTSSFAGFSPVEVQATVPLSAGYSHSIVVN